MKIVTQNLKSEISQDISFDLSRKAVIGSISPLIVMVGSPVGTFKFSVLKNGVLLYGQEFSCSDLKAAMQTTNNHAYLFFPFLVNIKLSNGTYKLKLNAVSSYSPTATSFIGWGQQHENIQNNLGYTPTGVSSNPLSYRIKIITEGIS